MGRYCARRSAVFSHRAARGRDRSLGPLSLAGHRRPDIFLVSMGRFALGDRFCRNSPYSLGLASDVQKPAAANGDMAFPLPDLPIDAGVRRREAVERRSDMAKSDGIELS